MVTETRTVEVPVEVYKALPESLTAPLAYPAGLPEGFTVEDLIDALMGAYDVIDAANEDRADAAQLTRPVPEGGQ